MHPKALGRAGLFVAASLFAGSALAAGGGGGDGSSGSTGSSGERTVTQCKNGKVWDKNQKKCVEPKQGYFDDDTLYHVGRALAEAGRYDEAIKVLSFAADKTDPRILNYLGYSHRRAGRVLVGLGYYHEALLNNPDYTLVREYLGEAHLQLGDLAGAQEQLAEIEKRCGKSCEEYSLLSAQIDAFIKG
jgi:tetratricopeptide (TPR) repeat protein